MTPSATCVVGLQYASSLRIEYLMPVLFKILSRADFEAHEFQRVDALSTDSLSRGGPSSNFVMSQWLSVHHVQN